MASSNFILGAVRVDVVKHAHRSTVDERLHRHYRLGIAHYCHRVVRRRLVDSRAQYWPAA